VKHAAIGISSVAFPLALLLAGVVAAQSAPPRKDIPAIAKAANGAIVSIITPDKDGKRVAQGTGFLVSTDGRIVTNYHVIKGASSAIVKLPDGAFYDVDGVVAFDKARDLEAIKALGQNFPDAKRLLLDKSTTIQALPNEPEPIHTETHDGNTPSSVAAPLKVIVSAGGPNQASRDMANRLASRVGASNRYGLISGPSGADLLLLISCINIDLTNKSEHLGAVCYSSYIYYPWRNQGVFLSVHIDGSMDNGRESDMAETMFDTFVQNTSDENLAKSADLEKGFINATILEHPEGIK